jgi:hypothetical protein
LRRLAIETSLDILPGTSFQRARFAGMVRQLRKPPRLFPPRKRWRIRHEADDDDDDVIVAGGSAEEKETVEATR